MLSFVSSCSAQAADKGMLLDHHVTPSRTQPIVQDLRYLRTLSLKQVNCLQAVSQAM